MSKHARLQCLIVTLLCARHREIVFPPLAGAKYATRKGIVYLKRHSHVRNIYRHTWLQTRRR